MDLPPWPALRRFTTGRTPVSLGRRRTKEYESCRRFRISCTSVLGTCDVNRRKLGRKASSTSFIAILRNVFDANESTSGRDKTSQSSCRKYRTWFLNTEDSVT